MNDIVEKLGISLPLCPDIRIALVSKSILKNTVVAIVKIHMFVIGKIDMVQIHMLFILTNILTKIVNIQENMVTYQKTWSAIINKYGQQAQKNTQQKNQTQQHDIVQTH
jgi:hypothetical protein